MIARFAFLMHGVGNPFDAADTRPILYTDGPLAAATLADAIVAFPDLAELTNAVVYEIIGKVPGVNWSADPRNPAGTSKDCFITLVDDEAGTLGTLLLWNKDQYSWGVEATRIDAATATADLIGTTSPQEDRVYYIGSEGLTIGLGGFTGQTQSVTLNRIAVCGGVAKTHVCYPSKFSAAEDGTADMIQMTERPNWDEGFSCGLFCFILNTDGSIKNYLLRRGVVAGEPSQELWPEYKIPIKFLEDYLTSQKIGETSKEINLTYKITAQGITGNTQATLQPDTCDVLMTLQQAQDFFNEPLSKRSAQGVIDATLIASLDARMKIDPEITYEIKINDGNEWVFKINKVSKLSYRAVVNGPLFYAVKLSCSLQDNGASDKATIGS